MKIDVLYGYLFGFPKEISPDVTDYREWLVNNGYPKPLLDALGNNIDIQVFNHLDDVHGMLFLQHLNWSRFQNYVSPVTHNRLWASVEDAQDWVNTNILSLSKPTGATSKNPYMNVFTSVKNKELVVNTLGCLLYYYQEQKLNNGL